MRTLALLTDAFGGSGGIAKFNRDLLFALCSYAKSTEVLALPRLMPSPAGDLPPKLNYITCAANSKIKYVTTLSRLLARDRNFDVILCGHLNLLPLAFIAAVTVRAPVVLVIHGEEAWEPTDRTFSNVLAKRVAAFMVVSQFTKERFVGWTGLDPRVGYVLANCVDFDYFKPGPKNPDLVSRYALEGKAVLLTLCRLESAHRYKGIDEVLEVLPDLVTTVPNLKYLVAGGGSDLERLQKKVAALGLSQFVTFTGPVKESEKVDHYRLADAFVMLSRGEGFGIVYLEAMACGVPVIAGNLDGSKEALRNGQLGTLIDPRNRKEIRDAIFYSLSKPSKLIPSGLDYFSQDNFERRCHEIFDHFGFSLVQTTG